MLHTTLPPLAFFLAGALALTSTLPAQASPDYPIHLETKPLEFSDKLKTLVDVRYPKVKAPANGWPGVICLHGTGGTRAAQAAIATDLARGGYFTFAIDMRGYGVTRPAWDETSERRLLDHEECFVLIERLYGNLFDETKLAATGLSRGGANSLRLAAYSGKTLPRTSAWIKTGVTLRAVATTIIPIDSVSSKVSADGDLLRGEFADDLSDSPTSPEWLMALRGDYHRIHDGMLKRPITYYVPALSQNKIPIFAEAGYHDDKFAPNWMMDVLAGMQIPHKGLITGHAHGGPKANNMDKRHFRDEARRWFDHHVKGHANGIDKEPKFESSVQPFSGTALTDPKSHWAHRFSTVWPPATPVTKFYVHGNGTLDQTPPTGNETDQVIKHTVAAGYGLVQYVADKAGAQPLRVFPKIPFVQKEYVGSISQLEHEIYGRPHLVLTLTPDQTFFQISASLWARGPNGDRYLTGGAFGKRVATKTAQRIRIPMRDASYIVPKGHRLVVKLHNLSREQPPGSDEILWVPPFANVTMTATISKADPIELELPVRPVRGIDLTPRNSSASAQVGINAPMLVSGGPTHAGNSYGVYMGMTGIAPGIQLGATQIWLNVDALTTLALGAMNTAVLQRFLGKLDANGEAKPQLVLPANVPGIAGLRLYMVSLVTTSSGAINASEPIHLDVFR